MSGNMRIYNASRSVPQEAQRPISAGRLKGKTDINPMWRIKKMTELFGPCGDGWGYTVDRMWIDEGNGGEKCANVMISLWYRKEDGNRSEPIAGIGGNMLVAKESKGLYTSDECYKMALTDAISVACKALGIGADIYWSADRSKYGESQACEQAAAEGTKQAPLCVLCHRPITGIATSSASKTADEVLAFTQKETGAALCYGCYKQWKSENG